MLRFTQDISVLVILGVIAVVSAKAILEFRKLILFLILPCLLIQALKVDDIAFSYLKINSTICWAVSS